MSKYMCYTKSEPYELLHGFFPVAVTSSMYSGIPCGLPIYRGSSITKLTQKPLF